MATPSSHPPPAGRVARRRAAVVVEALDHAEALMAQEGVGALTVSEVARRMGIRGPSLYKYFPSRHAVYDALFARGLAGQQDAVTAAVAGVPRGVPRLRAGGAAVVTWAVEHPALAQLLFWRPVPGFSPSPETFAPSEREMADVRAELSEAVRLGQLRPGADADDAVRLWTVVLAGLISQQLANQPGVPAADGAFSRLTDAAIDLFLAAHAP
ncbi:TetR/AcrR family transcriptional regulator [Geodermatophilus sp. SYSU D01119]